jgi:hypothetical protein|tara:strand:+ start:185 stop:577 length:393 start_codon:yes stop_codon:yes gene_type:complete
MPKVKEYVPVVEPKSTSYLEIVELARIVTPHPVFKKDTVFVRVLKINRGNPAETFETEEHWEYDVPWPVEEVKVEVKRVRARNKRGQYVKDDPSTVENEAWVGGKAPSVPKPKRKRKSKIQNALTNLLNG